MCVKKFQVIVEGFNFDGITIAKWATILVVEFDTKIATFLVGIGKKGLLKAVSKVSESSSFIFRLTVSVICKV